MVNPEDKSKTDKDPTKLEIEPDSKQKPWYSDGLRFECSQCGDCCSGSPGFVWVSTDEMRAIAATMNMSFDEFEDQYTKPWGARRSLKEFPNGDCVFLDEDTRGCSIYDVRPGQCRTWPFWASNLEDETAWKRTCEECPGSGKGRLYELAEIETARRSLRI